MMRSILAATLAVLALGGGVRADEARVAPGRPTLFLIGDSTVNNSTRGRTGWGRPIVNYFDTNRIAVVNKARGGRSSRTYLTEGLWDEVAAQLKPGDFVLMQFGHNDGGPMDEGRARASLHGNGDEPVIVTNKTTGKIETVYSYGWYLRRYIADTKAKGATPIVLSLVARDRWKDGLVERAKDSYTRWAREAAEQGGAQFIDLNHLTATRYEQDGRERTHTVYFTTNDWTHTTPVGADVNAQCLVDGLRALSDCPLADYLRNQPLAGPASDAAKPLLVVLVGDSTMANYAPEKPARGWGMYVQEQFGPSVVVTNLAANGRSTKTFIEEGRWEKALALKPDYVLIQFGHNDSHAKGRRESTDAATDYREYLKQYIEEARDDGAVPVLVTPMLRRTYDEDGKLDDILQPYADAMKAVAAEKHAALIDLHAASRALYEKLGPEAVAKFASEPADRTHFNEAGARAMADLVLQELPRVVPKLGAEMIGK
jgi:lysophospholipase L1-like esterase